MVETLLDLPTVDDDSFEEFFRTFEALTPKTDSQQTHRAFPKKDTEAQTKRMIRLASFKKFSRPSGSSIQWSPEEEVILIGSMTD